MDAKSVGPTGAPREIVPANPAELTDEELLMRMAQNTARPILAEYAAAEFQQRHASYLYGICQMNFAAWFRSTDVLEDLVQTTFVRAFFRAATFQPRHSNDPDEQRWHVRGWLAQIARRLAVDMLRSGEDGHEMQSLEPDQLQQLSSNDGCPEPGDSDRSDARARMIRVVQDTIGNVLSVKQRDVMFARLEFYDPANLHQRLPRDVLQALVAKLGTSDADIRQEWKRIKEIIRQALRDAGFSFPL